MQIPENLKQFTKDHRIETIICHHYFNIPLALKVRHLVPGAQLLLETQDVQSYHYLGGKALHPLTRKPSKLADMLEDEMAISGEADALIHYNTTELAIFQEQLPNREHICIYPAASRNYKTLPPPNPDTTFDFLIVSSANDPNYNSLCWFLEKVWSPDLDARFSLKIVGNVDVLFSIRKNPLYDQYRKLFLGRVENLTEYYRDARRVILPVIDGQGIAIKTVEALSYGKVIVATPLAFRGFFEHIPETIQAELAPDADALRAKLLSCEGSSLPRRDERMVQLYEGLFSPEAQKEIYRRLVSARSDAMANERSTESASAPVDFIAGLKHYAASNPKLAISNGGEAVLRVLEYYLTRYFTDGRLLYTAETGCGLSTLVFDRYSGAHCVYHRGDVAETNAAVEFIKTYPDFGHNGGNTQFTDRQGASSDALLNDVAGPPLDIAFMAETAFPHPAIAFEYLCRRIAQGGILFLSRIDIPAVNDVFRHLLADEGFQLHTTVDTTAVFARQRGRAQRSLPETWWEQRRNAQNFPAYDPYAYKVGFSVPFSLKFDGHLLALEPTFPRGFVIVNGRPVTDSAFSLIRLLLDKPLSGHISITLDVECIAPQERPDASVTIQVNGSKSFSTRFTRDARQSLTFAATLLQAPQLEITLINSGLKPAGALATWDCDSRAYLKPNLLLRRIAVEVSVPARYPQGENISEIGGAVVSFIHGGQGFRFFVNNRHDSIQAHHAVGQFYEIEELQLIGQYIRQGARILDIGANIGNHTVWFEKVLKASKVTVIEPHERSIALLKINSLLNGLTAVDLSHLGIAFGSVEGMGRFHIAQSFNIAGAEVLEDDAGTVPIRVGDKVIGDLDYDFVKVDVEGAEIEVIKGLRLLIDRSKPTLFVEVWDRNRDAFVAEMSDLGYVVTNEYRRYDMASNLLLQPKDRAVEPPLEQN